MKVIYVGKESSGKSLQLAKKARDIVERNSKWFKTTGIQRPILSNSPFSEHFIRYARIKNVPIEPWSNLEDIIYRDEADVFIDEIIKYFDARNWNDLGVDAKHWLTQGAKSGIQVYGAAQDFSQVEKQFRLLCNEVYHVTKIIGSPRPMKTRPPVKNIWGVCMLRQVNPASFKGDTVSMESVSWPSFFFIDRADCEIFDTSFKIKAGEYPRLKHIERWCDICQKMELKHR